MNLDHIDKQVTRRQAADNGAVATLTQTLVLLSGRFKFARRRNAAHVRSAHAFEARETEEGPEEEEA